MAALLRSARLLKFSPSGLLHITGTKRTGPPLSRLYSGAVGGRSSGACSRHIGPLSENTSSRVLPHAVGCVRNYTVAAQERDEASVAIQSKQTKYFDWALAKLDNSVRRTGRITKTLLLRVFHDICRTGYPSGNQALLLLRSCGSLLPEVPLEERTELANRVWDKLSELGAQYDVSHYNALLKVYLQNEFKFTPTDFLARMEAAKIQPNRVTYQRLITAYCQNGDIEGASTILGFMKSKDQPISETVFNSLVTGHARAGDMESAKNILNVMRGARIQPGPDTYLSLAIAHAERGDLESLKNTLTTAESADCTLMDRDILQIIYILAKGGHHEGTLEMIECLRQERRYIPDAMNLCLRLITQGLEDTAFHILRSLPTVQSEDANAEPPTHGSFFLRHCINHGTSPQKIGRYCEELQKSNLHTSPLSFSLACALESKKTDLSFELMKIMKEQGFPVKPHYFWPLFTQHVKDNNTAGVVELLKSMQALEVLPDVDTCANYVFPLFPSKEEAQQAIKDAGISLDSGSLVSSEVRSLAFNSLAKLYTLLSDPSFPPLHLSTFRNSLVLGFKKSTDVESMVKITKLLYTDKRFSKGNSAEITSYFLYSLINNLPPTEIQAQEEKLQNYFNQLKTQDIIISRNLYRGIHNQLEAHQVPELLKAVFALVDPKDRMAFRSVEAASSVSEAEDKLSSLEKKLATLKEENKSFSSVLKQIIQNLCSAGNLQRALEVKQEHEESMTAGCYAKLINLCCRLDNVEEALNLKRELNRMDSSVVLDTSKYMALVRLLCVNGKVEEAVDLLKEMKEKDVMLNDSHFTMLFHILRTAGEKGGISVIRHLTDTIFTLGLAKPTSGLCSPLITAYLDSDDLPGALEAVLECQKHYGHMPRIHDIIVALVMKGDTELLQKAMDFVSQERGEMTMLYDLFFAFLQTGRYREARKIIETPGLRARPGRLQWFADKCISSRQMETLEQMVELTAKLFECDRDEMYSYTLRLCKETNDWQKAETLWTKMQEENVIPRERTLHILANILRKNGQEVPFEVPETWYEQPASKEQVESETSHAREENDPDQSSRMMSLCRKGKVEEAYTMLMDADKKGLVFGTFLYDHLIRTLLAKGSLEEAMAVKDIAASKVPDFKLSDNASSMLIITHSMKGQPGAALQSLKSMLQAEQVPSHFAVTRLVQVLCSHGDLAGIQEVESLMKGLGLIANLSNMLFVNNTALAHIKNGDVESAVEVLETYYTSPDNERHSMSYVFRKVLEEDNEKALDNLAAMAERLANHFACYRPAADLFFQLLDKDKVEDAKFMLARCNAVAEQRDALVSYLSQKSEMPGQAEKVKTLMSLFPDFSEKDLLYSYLMKCHVLDKDLPSAKALYEQMLKEEITTNELTLKRLAVLYRNAGEPLPFTEPPESFKFYADKLKEQLSKAKKTEE